MDSVNAANEICIWAKLFMLSIVFLLDQNWSHWHHLTEQPRGAVVCYGLVS